MKHKVLLVLGVALLTAVFAAQAFAADAILINTNQPLELPHRVLPAGQYVIKPVGDQGNVVQVLNMRGHSYGFFLTEPVQRAAGNGVRVELGKSQEADARVTRVFDAGEDYGFAFEYPKRELADLGVYAGRD